MNKKLRVALLGGAFLAGMAYAAFAVNTTYPTPPIRQTVFLGNGTFSPPTGTTYIDATVCGGGGGGGGGAAGAHGGGGGGGSTATRTILPASAGDVTVVIGAAGAAGAITPGDGGDGGNSTLTQNSIQVGLSTGGAKGIKGSGSDGTGGAGGTATAAVLSPGHRLLATAGSNGTDAVGATAGVGGLGCSDGGAGGAGSGVSVGIAGQAGYALITAY